MTKFNLFNRDNQVFRRGRLIADRLFVCKPFGGLMQSCKLLRHRSATSQFCLVSPAEILKTAFRPIQLLFEFVSGSSLKILDTQLTPVPAAKEAAD